MGNDHTVVLYGGNNNWFAAYAYWYFKLYGHQDVKLLDGGRKKWELDSRELTDELPTREQTSYTAQEQDTSIRAFRDETVAAIGAQNLVDVRSPDEYAGRLLAPAHLPQEQAQRAGHIPTAANVPWSKAANDDGTFRSDDELKEIYTEAGVDWDKDTIAYCRIGERSSHTWFVLKELLGQENVKNYDGSWTEYGSLVGVPVALGDERRRGLMCGATEGGLSLDGVNVAKEAVIQGQVVRAGSDGQSQPVGNAYVRLLDRTGEFTAEVPTSATGHFRFFAGEGDWTLRTLAPQAEPVDQHGARRGRLGRRGDRRDLSHRSRPRAPSRSREGARPALSRRGVTPAAGTARLRSPHYG